MSVITITKDNFNQEVMESDKTVMLDFWASWCGPCRMLSPVIDEIAEERTDIKVGKVNVDEQPELARSFRVMMSEDGRDITLYRLFKGDVCILSASCVLEAITFDVFIDAEEDTDVLLINSSIFHRLADRNIYVKCFGYQLATVRFSDVMWAMQQILFMGADKRLACFLWNETAKSGSDDLKMTHGPPEI